jgi:hypothetical protein
LVALGWVTDLFVAGSLASGDYVSGISDLDLVALVEGRMDESRRAAVAAVHQDLEAGAGRGLRLGCAYVDSAGIPNLGQKHPTWSHGKMTDRILSSITRAELVCFGYSVFGRAPGEVLPAMSASDIRDAARAELTGYWAWAAKRPLMWLDPVIVDLGLTSMARGRHAMARGTLLSKSEAIEEADAPDWLLDQLRARRRSQKVKSPRLRTALIGWRDARRTVSEAQRQRE